MTFIVADRVQETTNSPGTGTATLLGAVSGYQSFSTGIGANNTTFYVIADQLGTNWEVGLGALNATGTVLTRTTVYSSSNGGSTVNFATGTQYVWCDFPSSKSVIQGTAVNFSSIGATTAGTGAFTTLSASSTVSGAGFSNYFAAPPTIGNTTPNAGTFTALVATSITDSGLTAGRVSYNGVGGLLQDSANMTFSGTTLTLANDASISGLTVGKGGGAVSTNTAVGVSALTSNTSGASNQAFGSGALSSNTSGNYNSAFAQQSLGSNSTGSSNSAFGYQALVNSTTASNNTAVGYQSLYSQSTGGAENTAVGYQAGYSNTAQTLCAIGSGAAYNNTTGADNTAIGSYRPLYSNTTGSSNVAIGRQALYSNTIASTNTAVGYQAGYANTTGNSNTFIGCSAGLACTTGSANTFIGNNAGLSITTGFRNTFVGNSNQLTGGTGSLITTGTNNSILGNYTGNQGGLDIRTASNYIVLSDGDGNPRGVFDNNGNFYVGPNNTFISGRQNATSLNIEGPSGRIIYNHASTASGSLFADFAYNGTEIGSITQTGTTAVLYNTTSDYRLKNDVTPIQNALATVQALNPVSFTWVDGRPDDGFIAHELQAVLPNCVTGEKDAVNEDGTPKYQQMDNSGVIPFLVKAIQELNAKVTALEAQLGAKA